MHFHAPDDGWVYSTTQHPASCKCNSVPCTGIVASCPFLCIAGLLVCSVHLTAWLPTCLSTCLPSRLQFRYRNGCIKYFNDSTPDGSYTALWFWGNTWYITDGSGNRLIDCKSSTERWLCKCSV